MDGESLDEGPLEPLVGISRLFQEVAAPKPPASLLSLPDELLFKIFEHFVPQFAKPGRDWDHSHTDLDDLRSLQVVNRHIHGIAQPITWRALHLDGPEDEEEIATAQLYRCKREHSRVHALEWVLPNNFSAMSVVVLPLLSFLSSLHLTIPEEHNVIPSYLSDALAQLPSLRHLSLVDYTCFADEEWRIADKIPSLASLELRSPWEEVDFLREATNVRSLWLALLDSEVLATVVAMCLPHLETLRIEGNDEDILVTDALITSIQAADFSTEAFATFPLHTLILDNLDSLHDLYPINISIFAPAPSTPTTKLLKLLPPVRRLELLNCSCVLIKPSPAWSANSFSSIKHLTIDTTYSPEATTPILQEDTLRGLTAFLKSFPSLRTLTLLDFLYSLSPTALAATPIEDIGLEHSACLAVLLDFVRRRTKVEVILLGWLKEEKSVRCRRVEGGSWTWELWWENY